MKLFRIANITTKILPIWYHQGQTIRYQISPLSVWAQYHIVLHLNLPYTNRTRGGTFREPYPYRITYSSRERLIPLMQTFLIVVITLYYKHYLHFRFSLVDIDFISTNENTRSKTVKLFQHILLPHSTKHYHTTTTSGHYLDLNFLRR